MLLQLTYQALPLRGSVEVTEPGIRRIQMTSELYLDIL
jgi:hypothetical protein